MTYEDYKTESCDVCGEDGGETLAGLVLCLSCYEHLFEAGGGKISCPTCPCCGEYYTEYNDEEFDITQTQIPAILKQGYQKSIGKVVTLPEGYFGLYPYFHQDKFTSLEQDIPALAGKSYSISYHVEGLTLFLESKLSPSKATCEFYLFYEHDFKGSCEGIQQQLLAGTY
jgi:hypothetical protein